MHQFNRQCVIAHAHTHTLEQNQKNHHHITHTHPQDRASSTPTATPQDRTPQDSLQMGLLSQMRS